MDNFHIFGNEYVKDKLSTMISKDRIIPSILIYGEKGLGKSTTARYLAAALNCEAHNGTPCGVCRSCQMVLHSNHPDIIYVQPTSKSGLYRVKDDIRPVTSDAYIPPNESGKKVYIIEDAEKLNEECQNALLKIFEEPPSDTIFILTAENKQSVLETVLSRVFSFEMRPVTTSDSLSFLKEKGFSEQQAEEAISAFPSNPGRQLEYLNGGDVFDEVAISKSIIDAVCQKNEYELLKVFASLTSRAQAENVFDILSLILGSAVEISTGANAEKCSYNEGTKSLAKKLTSGKIVKIYESVNTAKKKIHGYANLAVATSALAAQIAEIAF
ncbi:MAG: DNA polymerase III subunit [Ruminococcus sp.]|nr:DNA polymerase III subunit [Ruminococcus sp.]